MGFRPWILEITTSTAKERVFIGVVVDDTRDSSGDIFSTAHKPNSSDHLRQPLAALEFSPELRGRLKHLPLHIAKRLVDHIARDR